MLKAKTKALEPSRLDKIRALADQIKGHQEEMLRLIDEEAAIDKAAYPSLPIEVLKRDIMKYGVCPCTVMLARLGAKERSESNG
jgi:hypothetical protein